VVATPVFLDGATYQSQPHADHRDLRFVQRTGNPLERAGLHFVEFHIQPTHRLHPKYTVNGYIIPSFTGFVKPFPDWYVLFMAEKLADVRISIALPEELRESFFMWCRAQKPRVSMNERLLQHIKSDLAIREPVPKPHPRKPR
jgi:hypothetical protein